MLRAIDTWHRTRLGYLTFAIAELLASYGFASLSIDRGNLWWYLLTIVFLVGFLRNAVLFFKSLFIPRTSKRPKSHLT